MRNYLNTVILGLMIGAQAQATDWYVDGKSGSDGHSGSSSAPFKSISHGVNAARGGDTVHVLPTATYPYLFISKSGSSGAPITIKGEGSSTNKTKIYSSSQFPVMFGTRSGNTYYRGSYINLLNFDISGSSSSPYSCVHITETNHHILLQGNTVHNCGGNGISTAQADYVTIRNNIVYGNANHTANNVYGSGISVMASWDSDSNRGIKMIVDGNTVYNNTNVNTPKVSSSDSDGSGIILDDNLHIQNKDKSPISAGYKSKILVTNNVVFSNGGRGIHMYQTDHGIITNNTVFHNNRDSKEGSYNPGEITIDTGGDVQIYNNILSSDGAKDAMDSGNHRGVGINNCNDGSGAITVDYNVIYNSAKNSSLMYFNKASKNPLSIGSHNKFADPLFVNAVVPSNMFSSFNLSQQNLKVKSGSPAQSAGLFSYVKISTDIAGVTRGNPPDDGAYEITTSNGGTNPTPTPTCTESGNVYYEKGSGGVITDGNCNKWSILSTGHLAKNGASIASAYSVFAIAYNGTNVTFRNTGGTWYNAPNQ